MLNYRISEIAACLAGHISGPDTGQISSVFIDSRTSGISSDSLFFALHGPNHDGHQYIPDLIKKGVRYYVVDKEFDPESKDVCLIQVDNTLEALQKLARKHRESFTGQVIGITGSNGKTIIKEWLEPVLSTKFFVQKSPKSFNSQVGVALAILQSDPSADWHILEAGISKPGEMAKLRQMIQPDWGLISNLGDAHQENFSSLDQKLQEKLGLFEDCTKVFCSSNHPAIARGILSNTPNSKLKVHSWGVSETDQLKITESSIHKNKTLLRAVFQDQTIELQLPFLDSASIENMSHVWLIALNLGISQETIQEKVSQLEPIAMRMEQKEGINGCTLINDFYNSDFRSLQNAIDLLIQQTPQKKKTIILSDILQTGVTRDSMLSRLKAILSGKGFTRIIGIGPVLNSLGPSSDLITESYSDTDDFLDHFQPESFKDQAVLLKGARSFEFEKISARLEQKIHRTLLRINMPILLNNLNLYRNFLGKETKIMGMVKAFSYGSGTHEVARFLAHQQIDYLAVAFIDEGVALRQAGVRTPIMVMNPDFTQSDSLIEFNLEPEVFSPTGLKELKLALKQSGKTNYPIHIKVDTGMHRLGFISAQLESLIAELKNPAIQVCSIFSHLAAAEDESQDEFTETQIRQFEEFYTRIALGTDQKPLKHILNTAGIERFSAYKFDMVRLGIGLYGVGGEAIKGLASPIRFESYISQIHQLNESDTIGYGRSGRLQGKGEIGIIPVGYADGFDRRLGNGNWLMRIGNQSVPTIGNVCMDMCMIDLTGTQAKEGDVVSIVDGTAGIRLLADKLETIPYEILTGFSQRIKRVYEFE